MKRESFTARILCLIVVLCILFAMPLPALSEEQPIPWLTYVLEVLSCADEPDNIEGNPVPVDERYFVVTFGAAEDSIMIMDIIENITMFSVADLDGNEYTAAAYFPHSMVFMSVPGVFSTAQMQGKFDVMFIIPRSVSADSLILQVEQMPGGEKTSLPLSGVVIIDGE